MFKRKKKKEVVQPEEVPGVEEPEEELPEPPKPKKPKEPKAEQEPKGEFSLNEEEMALAVNALASSEEFKVYQQMVIGQQIANIITSYNKAVGGKSEVQEDTNEEETLPK